MLTGQSLGDSLAYCKVVCSDLEIGLTVLRASCSCMTLVDFGVGKLVPLRMSCNRSILAGLLCLIELGLGLGKSE